MGEATRTPCIVSLKDIIDYQMYMALRPAQRSLANTYIRLPVHETMLSILDFSSTHSTSSFLDPSKQFALIKCMESSARVFYRYGGANLSSVPTEICGLKPSWGGGGWL